MPEKIQSPVWRQIGLSHAKLNQSDSAIESFKKAIALAPEEKQGDYRKPLFQYYVGETKYEEALSLLTDPQITEPTDAEKILLMAADTYGDALPQLAVTALERAIRVNPDNMDTYFKLGQMYFTDGTKFRRPHSKVAQQIQRIGNRSRKAGNNKKHA